MTSDRIVDLAGPSVLTSAHEVLFDLLADSQTARLASPYLGLGIARRLSQRAKTAALDFLTCLDPAAAASNTLSVHGLQGMLDARVAIRHLPGLHAKVYLGPHWGLGGSANLTAAGLGSSAAPNTELVAVLTEVQRSLAETIFEDWWSQSEPVTRRHLKDLERQAREVPRIPPFVQNPLTDDRAQHVRELLDEAGGVRLFLKGVHQDAAEASLGWGDPDWVANPPSWNHRDGNQGAPPRMRPGDLMLIYSIHAECCCAIVEVTGIPFHNPQWMIDRGKSHEEANRWPWVTPIRGRLHVPPEQGIPPARLGRSGQSVERGDAELTVGEMTRAILDLGGYTPMT